MNSVDINDIVQIIINVTGKSDAVCTFTADTQLFGAMPEIDSMAIINIVLSLEKQYGFHIDDEEVEQAVFESVGSLSLFVATKLDNMLDGAARSI